MFKNANSVLCPVAWLIDMLALRGPSSNDLLFRICVKGRWVPMRAAWFNDKLRSLCEIDGATSHGLRRGGGGGQHSCCAIILNWLRLSKGVSGSHLDYLSLPTDQAMRRDTIFSLCLP